MKILVAVDGSAHGKAAVHFVATRLAPHAGPNVSIELLNVQTPIPAFPARMAGAASVRAYHASEAGKALRPAEAILRRAGLSSSSRSVVGIPGPMVSSAAAREADLVVMGSHGRTSVGRLLFGSVTGTVLATCTTPLLIVRSKSRTARASQGPLRIGVAVDGSKQNLAALRYLVEHRALFGASATITLINVVPDLLLSYIPGFAALPMPAFSPETAIELQNEAFDAALRPSRVMLRRGGLAWQEARLVGNTPGDRIAAYAKENRLDLLVMGSHGHGALKSVALGSVTTRVAARCQTPLLVVRSAERIESKRGTKTRTRGLALA
jgi:nucleotide-binding universal stress UspA family protein